MNNSYDTMQSKYNQAAIELRRPLPLALAVLAVLGWLIVVGLVWTLVSQRTAHQTELEQMKQAQGSPVSYTHLTLPTILLV